MKVSESGFPLIRKFFSEMRGEGRSRRMLVIFAAVLVIAVLLVGLGSCEKQEVTDDVYLSDESLALDAWRKREEGKLSELLCQLDGVERCFVSISYLSGEESIRSGSTTVSFEPPRVGSVVVLYDGVASVRVKETLVDVVTTLYGIGSHRVSINLL